MNDEPMDPRRQQVGEDRLAQFIAAQGQLHAESMSLTLTLGFAAHAGYSDESLDAVKRDCRDLVAAAQALADFTRRMADQWRQQRVAQEREAQ